MIQTENRCNNFPKSPKGVSFGEVHVREHERILNTRPSDAYACFHLGWAYKTSTKQLVDDFEEKKLEQRKRNRCTAGERLRVLNEYGYSAKDVLLLEREKKKIMEERKQNQKKVASRPKGLKRLFAGWGLRKNCH